VRLDFNDAPFVLVTLCPDDCFYLDWVVGPPIGREVSIAPFLPSVGIDEGIPYVAGFRLYANGLGNYVKGHVSNPNPIKGNSRVGMIESFVSHYNKV
jgi:hypothetical protein